MTTSEKVNRDRVLGDRLEIAMLRQGLNNSQLARLSGLALSVVQRLHRGTGKSPSVWTVYALADALDVDVHWLTGRQDGK